MFSVCIVALLRNVAYSRRYLVPYEDPNEDMNGDRSLIGDNLIVISA